MGLDTAEIVGESLSTQNVKDEDGAENCCKSHGGIVGGAGCAAVRWPWSAAGV